MKYLILIDSDDYFYDLASKIYLHCDTNDIELIDSFDEEEKYYGDK